MEGIPIGDLERAFTLTTFELRTAVKQLFLLMLLYIAIFIVMITLFATYFENGSFIFDLFFISVFIVASSWFEDGSSQASSRFIMFQQLPLKRTTIIKSWFISHLFYTLPFLFILLIGLYTASTDLQKMMSPLTYLCFSIVLLCLATITVDNIPTDRTKKIDGKMTTKRILTLIYFAGLSIILTIIYLRYWYLRMKKQITTEDYF